MFTVTTIIIVRDLGLDLVFTIITITTIITTIITAIIINTILSYWYFPMQSRDSRRAPGLWDIFGFGVCGVWSHTLPTAWTSKVPEVMALRAVVLG